MNSLPLVGAEVQRIDAAFTSVSVELSGLVASLRDVDLTCVGTASADPAVGAGMVDLRGALVRLQETADNCILAVRRHGVTDATATSGRAATSSHHGDDQKSGPHES